MLNGIIEILRADTLAGLDNRGEDHPSQFAALVFNGRPMGKTVELSLAQTTYRRTKSEHLAAVRYYANRVANNLPLFRD